MAKLSDAARTKMGVTDFPATIDAATKHAILNGGDLSALSAAQRDAYCEARAKDLGLNPIGGPIQCMLTTYQEQNPVTNKWEKKHKLIAYATKSATDQLRTIHGVKIVRADVNLTADMATVTVEGVLPDGRNDVEVGAVALADSAGTPLSPSLRANAVMRAMTKAKRRLTLSIIGAGLTDESELDTLTDAAPRPEPAPARHTPAENTVGVTSPPPRAPTGSATASPTDPSTTAASPTDTPTTVADAEDAAAVPNAVPSASPGPEPLAPEGDSPPTTVADICVEIDALYLRAAKRVDPAALKTAVTAVTHGAQRAEWSVDTATQVRNLLLRTSHTGRIAETPPLAS